MFRKYQIGPSALIGIALATLILLEACRAQSSVDDLRAKSRRLDEYCSLINITLHRVRHNAAGSKDDQVLALREWARLDDFIVGPRALVPCISAPAVYHLDYCTNDVVCVRLNATYALGNFLPSPLPVFGNELE